MFDLRLINGELLDGTGTPSVRADIGIVRDHIAAVGDLSGADSTLTLDVSGRVVCPGFIDAHSHSDTYLLIEPSSPSKIFQGITTEIIGQCGTSAAPLTGEYRIPSDWLAKEYPGSWRTMKEYRELLGQVMPGPNVAALVGHSNLRAGVVGYTDREATQTELDEMCRLLERSMEEGGCGLSAGLIYAPGMFASTGELTALARIVAKHDGVFSCHMRSEGTRLLQAIEEVICIGKDSGVRVEMSHLKTSGHKNWDMIDSALDLVRKARDEGVVIAADRYPYISAYTELDVIFPDWAAEGGREAVLKRLRTREDRGRLKRDLSESRSSDYWSTVTIGSTNCPDNARFRGMALLDVAKALGIEPVDAVLHLTDTDELRTTAFFFGMSEDNMWKILAEPYVMLGTDASLRSTTGVLSEDYPHPRAYGTFPRFLRASLDGKTVQLPEAVRKMTALPAGHFRLEGRGVVAVGKKADIVVFDPKTVKDTSTYENPHQLAVGIEHVIVNGVLTMSDGCLTGDRGGRFVK